MARLQWRPTRAKSSATFPSPIEWRDRFNWLSADDRSHDEAEQELSSVP
jgi:hypothetical protein